MDLDKMRQYIDAADALEDARRQVADAEANLRQAEKRMALVSTAVGEPAPDPTTLSVPRKNNPTGISVAELRARTMAINKKLRGDSTIAMCQAMPGTITEIVERTGVKKTSASTMLNRLMKDGIVKKAGTVPIPGYENRTTTVYDLAV
jgi:hypothetical protein